MASDTQGGDGSAAAANTMAASAGQSKFRQLQLVLTLLPGERSFGMSLAQRQSPAAPRYTVVGSVFHNSPASRASVPEGCVVLQINGKPMGGLTVTEVAAHFHNVAQTRITLEIPIDETPRTGFAGVRSGSSTPMFAGLQPGSVGPPVCNTASAALAPVVLSASGPRISAAAMPGLSSSSGRAISAPGTALFVPGTAAPKPSAARIGAKPAAKTVASLPAAPSAGSGSSAVASNDANGVELAADPKPARSNSDQGGLTSNGVAAALRLGPKPAVRVQTGARDVTMEAAQTNSVRNGVSERSNKANMTVVEPVEDCRSGNPIQLTAASAKPTATSVTKAVASPAVPKSPVDGVEDSTASDAKTSPLSAVPARVPSPEPIPAVAAAVPTPAAKAAAPNAAAALSVTNGSAPLPAGKAAAVVAPTVKAPASAPAPPPPVAKVPAPAPTPISPRRTATRTTTEATPPSISANKPLQVSPKTPAIITQKPSAAPVERAIPAPALTCAGAAAVARNSSTAPPKSVPSPAASTAAKPQSGKKRGRPRKVIVTPSDSTPKAKAKQPQQEWSTAAMDASLEEVGLCLSSSDDEPLSKKSARRPPRRRSRATATLPRPRHSLTVDRLVEMGFAKEDAEASVKHVGDDPEQCMVWIVSTLEERQFTEQLNQASIQSEQSKRDEEKRVKKQERETLAHATAFTSLFPTSFMLSSDSSASRLKQTLDSTIGQVDAKSYLREILTKLLKLEGQAIRWYKQAAKSYMLDLAARLESALGSHDVVLCCACVSAKDARSSKACCAFVRALFEEEQTLTKALFEMPSIHGGVPLVFLRSDEAMQFNLEDDGFEVLEDVA